MGLSDPTTVDIIHEPPPGEPIPCKLVFIIIDAAPFNDNDRYALLIKKLTHYLAYIASTVFAADYPAIHPEDVIIRILHVQPPTIAMQLLHAIKTPDEKYRIRVFLENYHSYMQTIRAPGPDQPSMN